jgi:hypothetical protein
MKRDAPNIAAPTHLREDAFICLPGDLYPAASLGMQINVEQRKRAGPFDPALGESML